MEPYDQEQLAHIAQTCAHVTCDNWADFQTSTRELFGDAHVPRAEILAGIKIAMIEMQPWPGVTQAVRKAYSYGRVFHTAASYLHGLMMMEQFISQRSRPEQMMDIGDSAVGIIGEFRAQGWPIPAARDIETAMEDHLRPLPSPQLRQLLYPLIDNKRPGLKSVPPPEPHDPA